jgi:hypothetical protein
VLIDTAGPDAPDPPAPRILRCKETLRLAPRSTVLLESFAAAE